MITGGQFVPLAKILGDIFILSGTDKLIFIQHFTFIQASQQKHYVILVIQEKLSYWCQDFFSSYLNRGSITILYTTKHFAAESRPGIPLQSSIPVLIAGRHTCTNSSVSSSPNIKDCRCKGVCLLRFPTKLAEHRLLFIAQPSVMLQPSFLESS